MIKPIVGRVVWLHRPRELVNDPSQPEAASISYVHSDRMINIGGFNQNGQPISATSVILVQEGDPIPKSGEFWAEWMPYQKGQAAKTEQLERIIQDSTPLS